MFRELLSSFLRAFFCCEGGLWGLIVLIPDHCLSLYFDWLTWLDLNIFRQINVIYLVFFHQLSNELRWLDTFARSCPHADLLFVASYESMWFEYIYITLYALFNVSCDNDFAYAKAHAPILNFPCLICTGYCSVLPVNWLLRVLYFAWLLIKGSSFDLVSHVDVKRVHKTKCNEWMQNRIRSLWPTSYTKLYWFVRNTKSFQ